MNIEINKITTLADAYLAIESTMHEGFEAKCSLDQLYRWEHSPSRTQLFKIEMIDIPTFVSVHFVRHKIGVEHFVTSKRDDRIKESSRSNTYCGKTAAYFREIFYEKDGKLFWKRSKSKKIKPGTEAGCVMNTGYWQVSVDHSNLLRHRIIFGMSNGFFPAYVDHVDRDKSNDRPSNLRESTQSLNSANTTGRVNNQSGFKGVIFRKDTGKWVARIKIDYKSIILGNFESKEEAAKAYDKAAFRYFGDFAVLNFPIPHRLTPVRHTMFINADALINVSRKRLCYKSSEETRAVWSAVRKAIEEIDPDLARYLVPNCVYRGGYCCEPRPCGNYRVQVYNPDKIWEQINATNSHRL